LAELLSWQRTTPRPVAHVARPVTNWNGRDRTLQYRTIDTAGRALRK